MCVYSTNITTTTTVRGGEGSRRWRLAEGQTPRFLAQYVYSTDITTTFTVQRGEGSQRWRLVEGQTPRFLTLRYQPVFDRLIR